MKNPFRGLRYYFPSRGPHHDHWHVGGKMYPGWVWQWMKLFRLPITRGKR